MEDVSNVYVFCQHSLSNENKTFVASEIQYFELGIFSFNSYVYYLTRAINLLTRAFNLPTRAFNLPTRAFNLAARAFSLLTREFELVTRGFELVTREFELVTRGFELVTRGFELVTLGFELVTRGFELVTRVLLFHHLSLHVTVLPLSRAPFCTAAWLDKNFRLCIYDHLLIFCSFAVL